MELIEPTCKKKVWSHIIYRVGGSGKPKCKINNIPTLVMYIA